MCYKNDYYNYRITPSYWTFWGQVNWFILSYISIYVCIKAFICIKNYFA